MKKYPIHKELRLLGKIKFPHNPSALSIANVLLRLTYRKKDSELNIQKIKLPGYQGELINVYVIEPKNTKETMPCIFDFHGGGFMLAASPMHFNRAKEYAKKLSCKVIFPDYRLAPKYKCPTALEDCFAVYKWALENAKELHIDTDHLAVLGDSAGGNLAVGVTLLARDSELKMPCYQMLIYPATDRRLTTESMEKYVDTPVWDARLSHLMWELYLEGNETEYLKYVSPMEEASFEKMPEAYVEVAEFDAIRDEGLLYAERLKSEEIPVEVHEVKAAPHGYDSASTSELVKTHMARRIEILQERLWQQ